MAKSAGAPESVPKGGALECPHCGNSRVIKNHSTGKVVCPTCGYVIEERSFDRGPEWRAYDQEGREKKSRAGPPRTETIHDRGLSTQIDYKNRDARGKNLPPEKRAQMSRLRKWHKRGKVEDGKDRNLAIALGELDRLSSQLGLPRSVEEGAAKIYRKAVEERMIRGRSIEGMISAVVYLECRRENLPRTLAEIAEVSSADGKKISHNQKFIERNLDVNSGITNPVRLVSRFGSRLGVSGEARRKAINLIRKAQHEKITSGKSPTGIAAAAIYIACGMTGVSKIQKEVARVADITEVTLRNRYKELEEKLEIPVEREEGKAPVYKEGPAAEKAEEPEEEKQGEKKQKTERIGPKLVRCENVVASVKFKGTAFDLEKLADTFDVDYRPNDFPGVSYSPKGTEATFLIFESGKANCVGVTSTAEARKAPKLLAEKLAEKGFKVDPDPEVEIQNMVVRADFGVAIDLEDIHRSPLITSYDPGSFPGLQLELDEPDVDFLLFTSGQAVLHSKREGDIEPALKRVCEILREFTIGSPSGSEIKKIIEWVEKNPRFVNLLGLVRNGAKSCSQIAKDLGVKEMTARQYVYECCREEAVEREKRNGEIRVEITENGKRALDTVT